MADMRYKVKSSKRYNGEQPQGSKTLSAPFQTFEDLQAYQIAREFRRAMYRVNRRLPGFEKFELASQIRRAAVSLTNNISEGHGRYHYADQIRFLLQARGSLQELIDDLNICLDEEYIPPGEIETLKQQGWRALSILNGYGRYLRQEKAATQTSKLREVSSDALPDEEDDLFTDVPL